MSFISDILGQNTQLYPIITIEAPTPTSGEDVEGGWIPELSKAILLSTNNVSLDHIYRNAYTADNPEGYAGYSEVTQRHFKPLLLNIPSIKESIDIESRRFKISNVSLDISNIEYEGARFTDILSETSLINWLVSIQFVSPTANMFSTIRPIINFNNTGQDNSYSFYQGYNDPMFEGHAHYGDVAIRAKMTQMVYQGIIRRISHNDTKATIELEDLTEQKAHKDLPQTYLGTGDDILDKYKNKPIPMVYGEVDRSPAVIGFSSSGHKLLFDSKPYGELNAENTLFVNSDDHYLNIFERLSYNDSDLFDDLDKGDNWEDPQKEDIQYEIFDDYVLLNVKTGDGDGIAPSILFDTLLCYHVSPASSWSIRGVTVGAGSTNGSVSPTGDLLLPVDFPEYAVDSNSYTICSIPPINTEVTWSPSALEVAGLQTLRMTNAITSLVINASVPSNKRFQVNYVEINGVKIYYFDAISQSSPESSRWLVDTAADELNLMGEGLGTTNLDEATDFAVNMASLFDIDDNSNAPIKIETYGATEVLKINTVGTDNASISFSLYGWRTNAQLGNNVDAAIYGNFNDIKVASYIYPDRILSNNFYANVKGRINTFTDHPSGSLGLGGIPVGYWVENPIDIIYDLVRSELGHDAIDNAEYAEAKLAHDGWKFGFTVNKKINSKKLIEDIAKSPKCFPKFKNDGTFGFNTIKDRYTVSNDSGTGDYENAHLIKESEVISYSFKKTKPEQIYRKLTVNYKKDYSQGSYLKNTIEDMLGVGQFFVGGDYYPNNENELNFESDYIRHKDTAIDLRQFLTGQYWHDHLILNLKLPLQYINLDIGDLVKLRELLGGVKAYGIDYRLISGLGYVWGVSIAVQGYSQYAYPLFMVTSITKNLDSISIECMQLHHLPIITDADVYSEIDGEWFYGTGEDDTEGDFYFPDADPITPPTFLVEEEVGVYGQKVYTTDVYIDFNPSDPSAYGYQTIHLNFASGGLSLNQDSLPVIEEGVVVTQGTGISPYNFSDLPSEFEGGFFEENAYIKFSRYGFETDINFTTNFRVISILNNYELVVSGGDANWWNGMPDIVMERLDTTDTYELGDVNLDYSINILDVVTLVNFVMYPDISPTGLQQELADLNSDDTLDILDIVTLHNYILLN